MEQVQVGVIGGSGLYAMDGLSEVSEVPLETPFGLPSDPIVVGTLAGKRVAFLARHGRGHRFSPSEVNYRANIFALKLLGVQQVISVSACGSLQEYLWPGDIVIPNQLFDHTRGKRANSFFGRGLVAHVGVADPFCPDLSRQLLAAVQTTGARVHDGGRMITIEGPRFSTKAESNIYRKWGLDLIGMTACPEAFLAREAEMCYALMAHVTDYDVWHYTEEPVTVEMVMRILNQNTAVAQRAITRLVAELDTSRPCACAEALSAALITARDRIPPQTRQELAPLIGKYLGE